MAAGCGTVMEICQPPAGFNVQTSPGNRGLLRVETQTAEQKSMDSIEKSGAQRLPRSRSNKYNRYPKATTESWNSK